MLTAVEDKASQMSDEQLLERSTQLDWVLFAHDMRFRVLTEH